MRRQSRCAPQLPGDDLRLKATTRRRTSNYSPSRAGLFLPQNCRKAGSSFLRSRSSLLKRSYPKPTCAASQDIVREIPPCEGSSDQRAADKGGSDRFQKGRMPQLKRLKRTGDSQNPGCDPKRRSTRPHQSGRKTPEHLIQQPACVVVEPPRARSGIKFSSETERSNHEQREQNSSTGFLEMDHTGSFATIHLG